MNVEAADAGLVQRLRNAAEALADQPVAAAYLFGSRSGYRARPDSDTDIAILFEPGVAPGDRFDRVLIIGALLGAAAQGEVDVVALDDAPLALRARAVQGILLYSRDDGARADYESRTLREYWDFAPRLHAMSRAYIRAVAEGWA